MSALRINLLPGYIAEMRQTRLAIAGFGALFALSLVGSLAYYAAREAATKQLEADATDMESKATAAAAVVSKLKSEASTLRAQIAPIGERVQFVKDVRFYNGWAQKVYRRAAAYTDKSVEYSSMAIGSGTLSMSGYVSKTSDASAVDNLSRYLITFYGNPDVSAVSVSGPPGWERPAQGSIDPLAVTASAAAKNGFSFTVNAILIKSLQVPALPASLSGDPSGPAPAAGAAPAGVPSAAGIPPVPGRPAGAVPGAGVPAG